MEEQVPFKVYTFWSENSRPEVRRFGIEKSVVTSFVYLNAKLQEIYPGLNNKTYSVTWKDEEGDDVTVSSDDEVMTALTGMNGNLIKLNINCRDSEVKDDDVDADVVFTLPVGSGDGNNTTHFGVVCDECDSAIVGFRYKCTSCNDYDLCTKCEGSGLHPEHCMVRIPSPALSRQAIKAAIKRSRHFLKTVVGATAEDCPYKRNKRDKSGERKHHGEHRGERHYRRQRSSWIDTFATYMNEFANLAGDIDLDTPRGDAQASQAPQGTQEQPKAPGTQAQPKTNPEPPKQPEPARVRRECPIGNLGMFVNTHANKSNLKTLGDMLGINLENTCTAQDASTTQSEPATSAGRPSGQPSVGLAQLQKLIENYMGAHMENLTQPKPSTSASNDASVNTNNVDTNNASVNTTDVEMPAAEKQAEADKQSNLISLDADKVSIMSEASSSGSSVASKRDESPDKADDWTMINKEKDLMDAYMKQGASGQAPAPGFNLPEEFQERVQISDGQNLYPPLNMATAVLNPKEAARPQPTAPLQATAPAQPPRPAEPAQPKPAPKPSHPKAHIATAIDQMLAMGFTNDGGWLTQLLENKDGNIAAVLDLLTPVTPKK